MAANRVLATVTIDYNGAQTDFRLVRDNQSTARAAFYVERNYPDKVGSPGWRVVGSAFSTSDSEGLSPNVPAKVWAALIAKATF